MSETRVKSLFSYSPKKIIYILLVIIIIAPLILLLILRPNIIYYENLVNWHSYLFYEEDHHLIKKFKSIEIGMTEQEVINILGKPVIIRKPFIVQTHGDRQLYGKSISNPNKAFLYHTGIDYTALFIFDEEDRVNFINIGGT